MAPLPFSKYILILCLILFPVSCAKTSSEGHKAPDFTLEKIGGGTVSLSEFKGKPVILYWFASW